MSKRSLSMILLSILALASIPPTLTSKASAPDRPQSADAQARVQVERTLQEANKSAVYDREGRVTKLTLPVSDSEKVSFSFIYDGQGHLQYLVQQDGTRMQLQYDAAGQWQGFIFSDGGRVTLKRDREGKVTGTRTERPTRHTPSHLKGANPSTRRVAFTEDACQDATDAAVTAVIAAGAACLPGPSIPCAAATALAAYKTYLAYKACNKEQTVAPVESAA